MEFYLHNKDDQKSSTLVELATTFKIDATNYIVYYNKEVEKSMIDIYIGIISYGDQSLVINKIDPEKQGQFLSVIKDIISSKSPKTEFGDYDNIIDTATIILESVQKIQIPTNSLDLLKKYHNNENEVGVVEDNTEELTFNIEDTKNDTEENKDSNTETAENVENDVIDFDQDEINVNTENQAIFENESNESNDIENNTVDSQENFDIDNTSDSNEDDNSNVDSTEDNQETYIHSNHDLNSLDNLLDERKEEVKKEKKKKKVISTPILILLIITIIGGALLYFLV